MLLTVAEFRSRVRDALPGLVRDLQNLTGRCGSAEAQAWQESFAAVDTIFSAPVLQDAHVYFGGRGRLELEYRLPASSSWCDMVLLGRSAGGPCAVIVELKNWTTRSDKAGAVEGLMVRQGAPALHPSDQVKGYTEYCRRYHDAVLDHGAQVDGCVVFTKDAFYGAYLQSPNEVLALEYPCFSTRESRVADRFGSYLAKRIPQPDEAFAVAFDRGGYRQSRGFVCQIGEQLSDAQSTPFELLDHQRLGHAAALAAVRHALFDEQQLAKTPRKIVVIIEGPPGSGKSVIAARLWASLVQMSDLREGDVVVTSTSTAQEHNWKTLFSRASGDRAAAGVVKKATGYCPYTTHDIGKMKKDYPGQFDGIANWRENIDLARKLGLCARLEDDAYLVSIVDEAHALINPEHSDARGQFGFPVQFGPLGYHIIRGSVVSVFLLDGKQSFRERETTTAAEIAQWAAELGAEVLPIVSLEGAQFRCGGSAEYVSWVEAVLEGIPPSSCRNLANFYGKGEIQVTGDTSVAAEPGIPYRIGAAPLEPGPMFGFVVCETPKELEHRLREKVKGGYSARLVASYARKWVTEKATLPHGLPAKNMDFYVSCVEDGRQSSWSRVWNHRDLKHGYAGFVQGLPGTKMGEDPLCEVGCPYTVRGFDYDFIGLLWFKDVLRHKGLWRVDPAQVYESGLTRHIQRAKKEDDPDGPAHRELRDKLLQGYRILLTRAIRGVYCWFEDDETRKFIEECLEVRKAP